MDADDRAHLRSITKILASGNNSEGLTCQLLGAKTGLRKPDIERLARASPDFLRLSKWDALGKEVVVWKLGERARRRWEEEVRKEEEEEERRRREEMKRKAGSGGGGERSAGGEGAKADHHSAKKPKTDEMSNPLFINRKPSGPRPNPPPQHQQQQTRPTTHPPPNNPTFNPTFHQPPPHQYAQPRSNSPTTSQPPRQSYAAAPTVDPRPQARLAASVGSPSPILGTTAPFTTSPVPTAPPLTAQQTAAAQNDVKGMLRQLTQVVELHKHEFDPEVLPALDHLEDTQGRQVREAWEKVQRDKSDANKRQIEGLYASLSGKSVDVLSAVLAPQLELAVERRVDATADQLKAVVANLQGIVDRERSTLQPFNYAGGGSSRGESPAASASGFRDRDALNATVATLSTELSGAIEAVRANRVRNRALIDTSVVAQIEALVEARVQATVLVREAGIERRVREDLVREVREADAAKEAAWEAKMEERLSQFAREVRAEAGRAQVAASAARPATPQPTPQPELSTTAIQVQVHDQIERSFVAFTTPLLDRVNALEAALTSLQAHQLRSPHPAPVAVAAPAPAPPSPATNGALAEPEDVKPKLDPTVVELADARQRLSKLEERLGLAALDARDAGRPEQDRVLPPGRTVADVLDENQVIMGEVVDTVNNELELLEKRIMALERGAEAAGIVGGGGGEAVAAEMDTTEG